MIVEPDQRVPDFIKAGADIVSVHCEQSSTIHLHRTINQVRIRLAFFFLLQFELLKAISPCIIWILNCTCDITQGVLKVLINRVFESVDVLQPDEFLYLEFFWIT